MRGRDDEIRHGLLSRAGLPRVDPQLAMKLTGSEVAAVDRQDRWVGGRLVWPTGLDEVGEERLLSAYREWSENPNLCLPVR